MKMAFTKGVLISLTALSLAVTLASCATDAPPPPPPPPPPAAPAGPPVALASVVSDAAAVYVDYVTTARTMGSTFGDGQTVQAKLQQGASYEPAQLARGVVAYAAIVAMQEPSFRSAMRAYAQSDDAARADLVSHLAADPSYVNSFPSAAIAARRVILAISSDGQSVYNSGAAVKRAAYDVQRQTWSKDVIADRDGRLSQAKQNSVNLRSVQTDQSAKLLAFALSGSGLVTAATTGDSTGGYVIQGDGVSFAPSSATATSATSGDESVVDTAPAPAPVTTPKGTTSKATGSKLAAAKPATDSAVPASAFTSTTDIFDRPDLFNTPYTNAINRGLTIAALAMLGEGGENRTELLSSLLDEANGTRCFSMSKLNLYQCLAVAKPYYEDVFCLGQHVLMDTGQCLGKMSSNALSFDPVRTISFQDHSDAEPYIKPVPVKSAVTKGKKKAAIATGKKRRH